MANLRTNNLFGESGQDSNGSALFDASNHLTAANVAAFRVNQGSSEDFTIEAWIYLRATPDGANARIASIYHTSGNQRSYMFYVHTDDTLKFNYASNGTAGSVSTLAAGTVPHNEWVHVAVTHDSSATTVRLFNNGVLRATDTGAHATYHANTSGDFTIGEDFNGNISNLHITRGTCKYTGDFIPSKEPIEEDSNTTVLCCNSRFNPLSDDKSNTFTQTSDGAVKASSFIPFDRADSGNVFNGPIKHNTQGYMYFPTGRTVERGRGRGVISGGRNDHAMQFINIQSQGNSITFGDSITSDGVEGFAVGSSTRGLFSGGYPSVGNVIEFITFATTSNGTDFGDMTTGRRSGAGAGNGTRGLFAGGLNSSGTSLNTIEFSTIATLGNSTDYGDLTQARDQFAGCSDTTRAIFAGGVEQGGSQHNIIEFVTIASTSNGTDFGDTTALNHGSSASSDSTRGVIALGYTAPSSMINTIDFITIQSQANAQDFGDLTQAGYLSANMSNSTRAVIAGRGTPSASKTIDFVTIQTKANAIDFGDLIGGANFVVVGTSDSHGGLS